ncbi:MAG: tetratricopeptide repeat protein [Oligoflexales bacterium]
MELKEHKIASYLFLAKTFSKHKLVNKAIENYEACLSLDNNNLFVLNKLGYLYFLLEDHSKAVTKLQHGLKIDKNSSISHHYLGLVYKDLQDFDKAIFHLKSAFQINPDLDLSAYHLAEIYRVRSEINDAMKWYRVVSNMNSQYKFDAHYMLAAFEANQSIEKAPERYIEKLYDGYAETFETNLLEDLAYKIPQLFFEILKIHYSKKTYLRCLDIGCGTGLCGLKLENICKYMDGVDLSGKMLMQAQQKKIYRKLHKSDLIDYLLQCNQSYDLVVGADVLIYFGDLSKVISLVSEVLVDSGKFLFSIESQANGNYSLQKTARFSHSDKYIKELAKQYKFEIKAQQEAPIRSENRIPLRGKVFLFQKINK